MRELIATYLAFISTASDIAQFERELAVVGPSLMRDTLRELSQGAKLAVRSAGGQRWAKFQAARASPAMAGPIAHFLVRAFASDDIDEFLHHITTIEACLGVSDDHKPGHKSLPDKSRGATGRTAWRLSALLNDPTAGPRFKALFRERSRFVHGEQMSDISGESRRAARALARRCVMAMAGAAPNWKDRAALLRSLVDYRPETTGEAEGGAGPA